MQAYAMAITAFTPKIHLVNKSQQKWEGHIMVVYWYGVAINTMVVSLSQR